MRITQCSCAATPSRRQQKASGTPSPLVRIATQQGRYQSELSSAIRRGWRPPRAMARGVTGLSGPTGQPSYHLQLQSLPHHREVDNLFSTALDADEEALQWQEPPWNPRRPNPKKSQPTRRRACQLSRLAHKSQPLQSTPLASAWCPGDPCMPCSALTTTQYRHLAACTSSIARTRCIRFTPTCSSANAKRAWPCCAKINAHAPP